MGTAADPHPTTIVWYRQDLRTDDHRPLMHAAQRGRVLPVYIHESDAIEPLKIGQASEWWLHHSLQSLSGSLGALGSPLILRAGKPERILQELCDQVGADQIAIHESTDPITQSRDDSLDDALQQHGIELVRFQSDVLWPVGSVLSGTATPYKVFTPFWNRAFQAPVDEPVDPPGALVPPKITPQQCTLDELELLDTIDWASGLSRRWTPGEPFANEAFSRFVSAGIKDYHLTRNQLSEPGWSALSAPLHFGELSVRRMWHTLTALPGLEQEPGVLAYLRQLGWRDFAIHLMNHFPETVDHPFRNEFKAFPWITNDDHLSRWKRGTTGYPIVDAAMRNLWAEGWMPNRARMIVASFLCKDLLISWKEGADWFWDTLVDADLPNNTLGWQWTAGCGADAAPYFRVFNPVSQGKKFDPDGTYVRKWIPELARLPDSSIHAPWEVPPLELLSAGITLGQDYPRPVVDHSKARIKALDAYEKIK